MVDAPPEDPVLVATSLRYRCDSLRSEIRRFQDLQSGSQHTQALGSRRQQVADAVRTLDPLCRTLALLKNHGIAVAAPCALAARAYQQLEAVKVRYESDPASIRHLGPQLRLFQDLEGLAQRLHTALSYAWQGYADAGGTAGDQSLLAVLETVPDFAATIESIRLTQVEITRRRSTLPLLEEDLYSFDQLQGKLKRLWANLTGRAVPPTVIQFLREAGSQGASLELLTPEVREWLDDRGITHSFRIGIANA